MNKKILYSIIGLVLVGGLFSLVYAGPIMTTITFAGNTHTTGSGQVDGDLNVDGQFTSPTTTDLQNQISNLQSALCNPEICDGFDNNCDGSVDEGGVCQGCGNNVIEQGESCDGTDLAGESCVTQGFDGGVITCQPNCSFDTSACFVCGNNIVEVTESCDGTDLAGQTCSSQGFNFGLLVCGLSCNFDTSFCSDCGNGIVEGIELCDDGNNNDTDDCTNSCLPGGGG